MQTNKSRNTLAIIIICFAFIVFLFILLLKSFSATEGPDIVHSDTVHPDTAQPTAGLSDIMQTTTEDFETSKTPSVITIDMTKIYINDLALAYVMDQGRIYPDSASCVDSVRTESDIIDYYGTHLVPPYIPTGLQAGENNGIQQVILSDTGEIREDTIWLSFYHDYYEDGSPKLTADVSAVKGFHLNASKIGLLKEFHFPTTEDIQVSDINGTPVIIAYLSKPYGPYTEDTHEPSGYYDFYVAQFTQGGIEYELVFEQIELVEVIKVVCSVICGENEFHFLTARTAT